MVKAKKHLGQHFLKDQNIALQIVDALKSVPKEQKVLEIGPGTGVLTQYLSSRYGDNLLLIDIDRESIDYLKQHYSKLNDNIIHGDFLRDEIPQLNQENFAVIGNFPYNISSQIFFKILEKKDEVTEVVCMLQKEVAVRLASPPGNKNYGILSVLLQAYYDFEYLFTVPPHVFDPPPKVESGVIRLVRNHVAQLDCDETLFKKVVKQGFQNRRKTLRNALKPLNLPDSIKNLSILDKRAEALSVDQFVDLTKQLDSVGTNQI